MILLNMKQEKVICGEVLSTLRAAVQVLLSVMDFILFIRCKGYWLLGVRWERTFHYFGRGYV
jgi:hypothetical protein